MSDIQDAIRRVRALRAKANDEAATEAEAESAARAAARLITKHDLSEEMLREQIDSGVRQVDVSSGKRSIHLVDDPIAHGIEAFCHVRVVFRRSMGETEIIGLEADTEVARYILEVARGASERSWKKALKERWEEMDTRHSWAKLRSDYIRAFGYGMSTRLLTMAEERREAMEDAEGGTALVVLKDQVVNDEVQKRYPLLRTPRTKPTRRSNAADMGHAAGLQQRVDPGLTSDETTSEEIGSS
jgi:hypothetical protein